MLEIRSLPENYGVYRERGEALKNKRVDGRIEGGIGNLWFWGKGEGFW